MNKSRNALALSMLLVACGVHAQSSVTLYGSLDAGVGYVSNLRGGRAFIAQQGTLQADRWGLTGVEDLGGGLKTVFKLESGFSTISGAMSSAGTLFNRQAYVGLSESRIGTVTLGRQTDFHFEMLGPLSTAQTLGAMYGFTNQSSSTTGRSISFGATYGYGPLNLAAAYSEYRDRTLNLAGGLGLTSFEGIGLTASAPFVADSVRNAGIGGSFQIGRVQLHALLTQVRIEERGRADNYRTIDGGANFQVTPAYMIGVGAWTTTFAGERWTQVTIANVYALSKLTQLYADVMVEQASSGAVANTLGIGPSSSNRQTVVLAGVHQLF